MSDFIKITLTTIVKGKKVFNSFTKIFSIFIIGMLVNFSLIAGEPTAPTANPLAQASSHSTPPGQDPDRIPPGQDPDRTPPGQVGKLKSIQIELGYSPDTPTPITELNVPIATEVYITAWGIYGDGSREYVNTDTVYWSSNQQVASINSIISSNVYGRDLGTATVTAYYQGKEASIEVTVVNNGSALESIEIVSRDYDDVTGDSFDMYAGEKQWLTAYGNYADGSREDINRYVAWSSSDRNIAWILDEVDSNVHGRSEGDATITAEWQGVSASTTAHVTGLNSIEIQEGCSSSETAVINAGNPLELFVGRLNAQCINAWGNYSDGTKTRITTTVFWSSEDRDVATMDLLQRDSEVTGKAPGSTFVKARLVGIEGSAPVNVTAAP